MATEDDGKEWGEFLDACSTIRDIHGESWGTITFENFKIARKRAISEAVEAQKARAE